MDQPTFYEILGLRPSASDDDIKKCYYKLARLFHPDVPRTGNAERFKRITEAYDILSDSGRRSEYDSTLATQASAGSRPATATATNGSAPGAPDASQTHSSDIIAGKYRIVREIARSNDVVYEAIDSTMGRRLAVKELVLPGNLTGHARRERIERFNREARAAGRLSHPNIVTVYDFGEDAGRYFIAMEFLEGGTLRDAIQARGSLPVDEAIGIACQVLSALAHAHSHRVVHRDVKPDNIHILTGGQVKLTDFGIARLTEEASLTGDGQVFGTPSYMSPEQIEGHGIDHRSDLFSLGIVLYEMLAGRKPFTGDSVVSITYAIMHAEPPPMPGVPIALEQIVMQALSKDPSRRYNLADDMRMALRNADTTPPMFLSQGTRAVTGNSTGATILGGPPQGMPGSIVGGYGLQPSLPMGGPPPYPSQPPVGGAGPFVNWGPSGQPPQAAPPPAVSQFHRGPSRPLVGPGTKTFLSMLLISMLLAGTVIGFVLLFVRAYDEHQRQASDVQVQQLVSDGNKLYRAGDLAAAARDFEAAMRRSPGSDAGRIARTNLATSYNRIGIRAYEAGDMVTAEKCFSAVSDLYGNASDIVTDADRHEMENAQYNLGRVYDRTGVRGEDRTDMSSPGSDSATNPDSGLQDRVRKAQAALDAGNKAWAAGDSATARDKWQEAVADAPGTPAAQQAQAFLDRTTNTLNY